MANKKSPAVVNAPEPHDPYTLRTLDQLTRVLDGGDFTRSVQDNLDDLKAAFDAHRENHPGTAGKGSFTLKLEFEVKPNGDTIIAGTSEIKRPKEPPATGAAHLGDGGEFSLGTPMMRRMDRPVRDVPNYDPDTGEIRDTD